MELVLDFILGGVYYNVGSVSGGLIFSLLSFMFGSIILLRKKGGFRNVLKGLGMKKEFEQSFFFVIRQREKLDKFKQVYSIDSFFIGEYCKFDFQNVLDYQLIMCCQLCNFLLICYY